MPDSPSTTPRRAILVRRLARPISLIAGLALLFPAAVSAPEPAHAGGSCTGWGSTTVPPNSIRVLRKSGVVERVDFRRYVIVVMGKEWGAYLPMAVLEAGAQASKQFAWYHSLAGNHRRSYVTPSGECYDVTDTVYDQLYRPGTADIRPKHHTAVDAIWGLSLRKSGAFFMTAYRAGTKVGCGADADGRRLYAKSATDCANRGWSSEQILARYYGPDLRMTWSDGSGSGSSAVGGSFGATLTPPRALFRTGAVVSTAPLLVWWKPTSLADKIQSYQIQRRISGSWRTVGTQAAADTDFDANVKWRTRQRFRVRATNGSGAHSSWFRGPRFSPRRADDRNWRVTWRGAWARAAESAAMRGTVTHSSTAGAAASFTFTGRAIAVVGTQGPGRGEARIFVNGRLLATVDLQAATERAGVVLYSRAWKRAATRTVRVVVVGTASRPRVDLDGFLFLR